MARRSGNWIALGWAVLVALTLIEIVWLAVGARPATFEAIVQEGSMAPTLLGPHYEVTCPECGLEFAIDAITTDAQAWVDCPNCHRAAIGLDRLSITPGDRVEFEKRGAEPALWEVVAIDDPAGSGRLLVKRVAGLPGQVVQIKDGDVWLDGQRAARPLAVLRQCAIVVHDAAHERRTGEPTSGWRDAAGRWTWHEGLWRHEAAADSADVDWLSFEYRPPATIYAAAAGGPILDDVPYNAAESRRLAAVADVGLRCELTAKGAGELWLRLDAGDARCVARLDLAAGLCQLFRNALPPESIPLGGPHATATWRIEWLLADGELHLAVGGRELPFSRDLRTRGEYGPRPQPLAIGASGPLAVEVRRLEVIRDVYYSAVPGSPLAAGARLGDDELLVLGDNSPASIDGRNWWPAKQVRRADVVGKLRRVVPRID